MRHAVCLTGLSSGRNDKTSDKRDFKASSSQMIKNIIENNAADVFIHTWNDPDNDDQLSSLIETYDPKEIQIANQINFIKIHQKEYDEKLPGAYHSVKSRWYSNKKVLSLKREYEKENNFVYDSVFVTRFDCLYLKPFDFSAWIDYDSVEEDTLYTGISHNYNLDFNFLIDYWFLGHSNVMNDFCNIFDEIDKMIKSGHPLSNHTIPSTFIKSKGYSLGKIMKEDIDFKLTYGLPAKTREARENNVPVYVKVPEYVPTKS